MCVTARTGFLPSAASFIWLSLPRVGPHAGPWSRVRSMEKRGPACEIVCACPGVQPEMRVCGRLGERSLTKWMSRDEDMLMRVLRSMELSNWVLLGGRVASEASALPVQSLHAGVRVCPRLCRIRSHLQIVCPVVKPHSAVCRGWLTPAASIWACSPQRPWLSQTTSSGLLPSATSVQIRTSPRVAYGGVNAVTSIQKLLCLPP